MATLLKGIHKITVPDDVADAYIAQGWTDASAPAAPVKKSRKRQAKPKTATKTKGAARGLPQRSDPVSAPVPADPGPVQPDVEDQRLLG